MRWGKGIQPGRVMEDFVNVRDFAPTYLELAGVPIHPQMTGVGLADVLRSTKVIRLDPWRNTMLVGQSAISTGVGSAAAGSWEAT